MNKNHPLHKEIWETQKVELEAEYDENGIKKNARRERRAKERATEKSKGAKFRKELNEAFFEGKFPEDGGILAMINERKEPVDQNEALEALRREHEAGNL